MNETNDCYPSAFNLSLKIVDIDIEEINKIETCFISFGDDDKDDTDMEEEIWRSRYGYSGLFCMRIYITVKEITMLMKVSPISFLSIAFVFLR